MIFNMYFNTFNKQKVATSQLQLCKNVSLKQFLA